MAAMTTYVSAEIIALATNTINRVMLAMDRGSGQEFASCFTEDAVVEVRTSSKVAKGTSEIAQLGEFIHSKFPNARHWEGNVCLSYVHRGDSETMEQMLVNESYWKAVNEVGEIISAGLHHDELKMTERGLLISKRVITHTQVAK